MRGEVLRSGEARRLVWGADENGRMRAKEHFESLNAKDQKSFQSLFERMADTGSIKNIEKFRHEEKNLFVFKIFKQRLACFFDGSDVVLISGFTKKSDKSKRGAREISTAAGLRDAYMEGNQ